MRITWRILFYEHFVFYFDIYVKIFYSHVNAFKSIILFNIIILTTLDSYCLQLFVLIINLLISPQF